MHIHVHIHIHICVYISTFTYTYIYILTCTYTYNVHAHVYVCKEIRSGIKKMAATSFVCAMAKRNKDEGAEELAEAKRVRLESQLAHSSAAAVFSLTAARQGLQRSGAFKRAVAKQLAPYRACFSAVSVPGLTDQDITFYVADFKQMLRLVSKHDARLRDILQSAQHPLRCILTQDEATAGNVLQTEARQKATLYYASFSAYGPALESATAWLPVAALSAWQVKNAVAGNSGVTAAFLREWDRQKLEQPFLVGDAHVCLTLAQCVADHDAQRQMFAAKGSKGFRPCVMCANCVSKGSSAVGSSIEFPSIEEADFEKFRLLRDAESQALMVDGLARLSTMPIGQRQFREKICGFRFLPGSVWDCAVSRRLLPISICTTDAMHCYWSNGIASAEINLFWKAALKATGLEGGCVREAVLQTNFQRPSGRKKHGETRYWTGRLFTRSFFEGDLYKGSASQTVALLTLLCWFAKRLWARVDALRPQLASLLALHSCCQVLLTISHTHRHDALQRLQQEHQVLFNAAYPGRCRPKHHHRLHLPEQYRRFNTVVTCWPTEAKHREYKGALARQLCHLIRNTDGGVAFSKSLLPRLLLRHCDHARNNPLLAPGQHVLLQPCQRPLHHPRPDLQGSYSLACRVGLLSLQEGDVVLWGNLQEQGGIVSYFMEAQSKLYVCLQEMNLQHADEVQRVFHVENKHKLVNWLKLGFVTTPAWCCSDDAKRICLP